LGFIVALIPLVVGDGKCHEPPAGGIEEASPKRMLAGLRVEQGATLGATLNPLQPGLQTAD